MELPLDCVSEIIQYLDYTILLPFSLTCKGYVGLLLYYAKVNSKFSTIILKYSQFMAVCDMKEQLKFYNNVVLCAPMGYGKTITLLYYCFVVNTKDNFTIVVPPNVFKVWIKELIQLKLYDKILEKSAICIQHSSRPSHHINHQGLLDTIHLSHRVFITTSNILCKMKGSTGIIIVDEAHKIVIHNIKYKKLICLTANKPTPRARVNLNYIYHGFIHRDILPTVHYKWFILNNVSCTRFYEHMDDMINYIDDFTKNLIRCVTQYDKTCIMVDRGTTGTVVNDILKHHMGDYKLFKVSNSLDVVDRYIKYKGKAILMLSSMANDGLNLLLDNIILIKPDLYCISRIKQTFGRIKRPNNPHKDVTINIITNGRVCILKIIYAIIYSNLDWTLHHEEEPSIDLLTKGETVAKLLGYHDIKDINMVDYAIIFDRCKGEARCHQVMTWWNKYKNNTKLTEDIIRTLYL
jgi:hypothetical protein